MKSPIVVANWKMHGSNKFISDFVIAIPKKFNSTIVICAPFVYLADLVSKLKDRVVMVGAQDVEYRQQGAITGGISSDMLRDVGCKYVIIGHSERRQLFGETNEIVVQKFIAATKEGLIPIVCVGETKAERDANQTLETVTTQLQEIVKISSGSKFIVAYEPIWAIGTGAVATPEQAQQVHQHISTLVPENTPILYGGSVKANNSEDLIKQPDIDGFLVGGASLKAEEFVAISKSV